MASLFALVAAISLTSCRKEEAFPNPGIEYKIIVQVIPALTTSVCNPQLAKFKLYLLDVNDNQSAGIILPSYWEYTIRDTGQVKIRLAVGHTSDEVSQQNPNLPRYTCDDKIQVSIINMTYGYILCDTLSNLNQHYFMINRTIN